jgi:hypothetical protein
VPLLLSLCCSSNREPLVTYYNGDFGLSVRYPASWKTDQAQQDGVWYRYFLGPPSGPQRSPEVSVTLLAGPLAGSLEDYAQSYLSGNTLSSSRDEQRQGTRAKTYAYRSADGSTRYSLLLLQEGARVYGLYAQGRTALFDHHGALLEEMNRSLTLERPDSYPVQRDAAFGFELRVPPSWRSVRTFSAGGTLLMQFTSPPLAAERNRETVHASLTLTVEPLRDGADALEPFYAATRQKLGDSFQIASHRPWGTGYVDVMQTETPIAISRVKRFYRVAAGRGYILSFEARDDVFPKASRWCDIIAATLKTGPEVPKP